MDIVLVSQRAVLASIVAELEPAIAGLPRPTQIEWAGPAQTMYSLSLLKLVEDAQIAVDALKSAMAATEAAMGGASGG